MSRSPNSDQSPAERARATLESFQTKVEILEGWAKDGLPTPDTFYPRKHSELRQWEGPESQSLPLGKWSDPMIDRPRPGPDGLPVGKYPNLIVRFQAARDTIHANATRKSARGESLKAENARLKKEASALAEQLDYLVGELERQEFLAKTAEDLAKAHRRSIDAQADEIRALNQTLRELKRTALRDATAPLSSEDGS